MIGYLLPIINKLMQSNSSTEMRAPFSFILVPTAELAIQVVATASCEHHVIHILLLGTFSVPEAIS